MSDRRPSNSGSDGSLQHLESSGSNWAVASGQGINMTIQNLQNEQERVQKKTFTNWMNTYLCQRNPPIKVKNLFEEIKDGIVLLSLLEVLSGEKLPMEKGTKLSRPHHLANISTALSFLEKKKIKLVNINATSIADGKPSIVLGLVWTIILYFQIEETFKVVPTSDGDPKPKMVLPKQSLLEWADSILSKNYGLPIKDFGKSWTDGVAINALIHNMRPDLVDMDKIRRQQARINLEHAFSTAENHLGIPRLLDPEDVDVEKPDEKSIMTYVGQFLKQGGLGTSIETADKEWEAYNSLMTWLNGEAREILDTTFQPVTNRESEFMDYLGFKTELDRRKPLFMKLGEKFFSGRSFRITQPDWKKLETRWQEVDEQVKLWLQKLDACLPGKLGRLGLWLYEAEKLLSNKEEATESADDMAALYAELVLEHREFFMELENWKQFFAQIKRAGRYEDMMLHGPHFDYLSKRMESVTLNSPVRLRRLEYLCMRFKLLAFMKIAEKKLAQWTAKYGQQDFVEEMLAHYVDYVDRKQLYENFDTMITETKIMAEKYKTGGADKAEVAHIDEFVEEISGRWKKVSLELKSVRSMLEETIMTWIKYNACVDVLTVWLAKGEQVMTHNLQAREDFFKDFAHYEEKHKVLNESANFLIDVSQELIGTEIKQTLLQLNRRFENLVEFFHSFCQNEIISKARTEYEKGIYSLEGWFKKSTGILDHNVQCLHADLKDHLLELDKCNAEIIEAENNFKITTKIAQSLVKDSSQEEVTSMLKSLNALKEAIVRIRKEVPERVKYLKAVLPNVESLETGILDLQDWLTEGEKLLKSHKMDGSPEETETRLERHKAFFSETTYQKSILESKNKVFQKISGTMTKLNNVDFTPAENFIISTNQRFQDVVASAKEWEHKLESLFRLWRSLQQKQQKLEEWLDTAQNILDDSEDDPESLIRKHKMFFDRTDHRLMSEYEANANGILQQLHTSEHKLLSQTLGHLKERWEHVLHHAPIKLLKLEFAKPENKFERFMEMAEVALQLQRDNIRDNQNLKEALTKHKQMFQEGNLIPSCEQWLDEMNNLAQQLLNLSRDEQSLDQRYWNHLERWKKLRKIADDIFLQLKQLPERWKEYNEKMDSISGWAQNIENLLESLSNEVMTGDEYREGLARLQREMRNMSLYNDDLELLEQDLEDLILDAPLADAVREREHLRNMQDQFKRLKSKTKLTFDKSGTLSKAYVYRDNVEIKSNWLDEFQKLALEYPKIDSLEDARTYLYDHEDLLNKLETEKNNMQAEIEEGRQLLNNMNIPTFMQQSIEALERKWKDVTELAKRKHEKLKRQLYDWENYEAEKATLMNCIKKAESELEKPLETLGQTSAQKDLQAKKELQNTLNKLKFNLDGLSKLNKILVEGASRERQTPLRGEITDFDKQLENTCLRLIAKITDLETAIAKWSEYHRRLNIFCDWLNEKELKLNEIYENKQDSLETQLEKAEGIASQVFENHITLENLEKDARGLTQNFKSRETAALKSKLISVRRQWESLCTLAKDRSNALSGNVIHWQKYQMVHDQLLPWVLKAEKYCVTELPKCMSPEEAKDLYDLHQAFLKECEDNLPIFDQLSTEAGYLMDQPNVQQELEAFQKRWGNILASSEDRSRMVDKVSEAWSTYGHELKKFQEIIEKFNFQLSNEPSINTCDVHVLEHELILAKTFYEEVCSQRPQLASLTKCFEQVQDYASHEGLKILKSQQDAVGNTWNDLNTAILEREKLLASALQQRKEFMAQLQVMEKWGKSMQQFLDSASEIYSDEVADSQAKLKSLKSEHKSKVQSFQGDMQNFKELIAVLNDDEAGVLSERLDKLIQSYTQMEDLINGRCELCDKWSNFTEEQKDIRKKIKLIQAQLSSPDTQEEEIAGIMHEIDELYSSVQSWSQNTGALDDLKSATQMTIKDRTTQRTLHFGSELKSLMNLVDTVSATAKSKEMKLGQLTKLSSEFSQQKDDLVGSLVDVQEKLLRTKVCKSNLQGLQQLVMEIKGFHDNLFLHNPEYEHLRELGRQIMASDPTKASVILQHLEQVNSDWETVQSLLNEKQCLYNGVANTWQQYNDGKQKIMGIIADLDPLIQQELTFTNQTDVKKSLDQHRNAEFELHANQTLLDHMNSKGIQLLDDLKSVPGFDRSGIECDLDDVNLKWETANASIEEHKQNLEAQLVCWDQVQSGMEEVKNWVNSSISKLENSLQHFDNAISVESKLTKFKDEAPYFEEALAGVSEKLKDLKDLNRNQSVPSLILAQKDIQLQFEKAASLANELQSMMSIFCHEEQSLQNAILDESEWMNQLKEVLSKCDDITGCSEDLIEKYETCKQLQQELGTHQHQITAIQNKASLLQNNFPSSESSILVKDGAAVAKKFDSFAQRIDRIDISLIAQLRQNCTEAQQQQLRWLTTAKEKLAWCAEIGDDRYSVEAKLATVKELKSNLQEGEQKRNEAISRLNACKQVLPTDKIVELEVKKEQLEREWQDLTKSLQLTQNNLDISIQQWQLHDKQFEVLSQWLKDTEAKMRTEIALQPDLASKKEHLKALKILYQSVQSHHADMENMRDTAQQISQSSSDSRTTSSASQLVNQYQILASALREQLERCEQSVNDHDQYVNKHKAALKWLSKAKLDLEQCSILVGDENLLNTQLTIVNDLLTDKENGSALINTALEAGESLYPSTSLEGRESIRQEISGLRDAWEGFIDILKDTQKKLDNSKTQWMSFDENYEQLNKWIMDADALIEEPQMKATLQEKKAMVQKYKVYLQDVTSHQTLIDSINEKGAALSSSQVQNKLKQLNIKYNHLCSTVKNWVKEVNDYVSEHQLYQDTLQQCQDLIHAAKDKVILYSEGCGDKQALQNRLDRLKEFLENLQEGETKIQSAHKQGEKTMLHTSTPGQVNIKQEIYSITSEWETLIAGINETQQGLQRSIKALEVYDSSCEILSHWLRETESKLKDSELRAAVHEKEIQVEIYKSIEQQIHSKQTQFNELLKMVDQVRSLDARLASQGTQLSTKYETLKNMAQDVIAKWTDNVEKHHEFLKNYNHCMEWMDTLRNRLKHCGEPVADKQDLENNLLLLQELSAEKDEGARHIYHTIESGEHLYPNTSPSGRDTIRQDIHNLRNQWEILDDEMSVTQHTLDQNLNQWSSFDESSKAFQEWLCDTEVKLKQDIYCQSTLPEKKAQLQNYKVIHQDILSREHVIDNLKEKAYALAQSSPTAKIIRFANELKHRHGSLCERSKVMLGQLDQAVQDHQQYLDIAQDFTDWLNSAREKIEACADRSGDKLSLKNKILRMKEHASSVKTGDQKLVLTKKLAATTAKNTLPEGQEVLQREMDHLQREWNDFLNLMKNVEISLSQTLNMWVDFESRHEQLAEWIKEMELKVKNHDLKSTLIEKQQQVDQLKKQHEEILMHQQQMDKFTDGAQNLMHASSDVRLDTQVSQLVHKYQGLLSLVNDLIIKWETYVQEHQLYSNRIEELMKWISVADKRIQQCIKPAEDYESLVEKKVMIQMLLNEKDHGHQMLISFLEIGEKLYADTAPKGREKVLAELHGAKQKWDSFLSDLSNAQCHVDLSLHQWSSYTEGREQILKWLTETESALREDTDLKNTLQEKRHQLQTYRKILQEITSCQKLVDVVTEKAQVVLKATESHQVSEFITNVSSRYKKLCLDAEGLMQRSEHQVAVHQQFQDSVQVTVDWLTLMKDRQTLCAETSGDRHTVQSKLDRLNELLSKVPEGVSNLEACENYAQAAKNTTGLKGRQNIQSQMSILHADWEQYFTKLNSMKINLEQASHSWTIYESSYQDMSNWLKVIEKEIKECPLKSTLEEKQNQLMQYTAIFQKLKGQQREFDKLTDQAQALQHLTSDQHIGSSASQLSSRYQTLLTSCKDLLMQFEKTVDGHKIYNLKLADSVQWLEKIKTKFSECSKTSGSRAEIEDRLDKVQNIVKERDAGMTKLRQCVEAGEALYPNTCPEGREAICQELSNLRYGYENVFDELSRTQRKLEIAMVEWTSFDESYRQVKHWLTQMQSQFEGQTPLMSTLEEKKSKLHNYKTLHQDVVSYQKVIQSVSDKAKTLAQTSKNAELVRFMSDMESLYKTLCAAAKERVFHYEAFVNEHQHFSNLYNTCLEWLNTAQEKLSVCSDLAGDQNVIQNRLDKIQDIEAIKREGEPRIKEVIELSEQVLPNTAPQGKVTIVRDTDTLRISWEAFVLELTKVKCDLEVCMNQWKDYVVKYEHCASILRDLESQLRDTDLRATLSEKQVQLDKIKTLQMYVAKYQTDLNSLSDAAHILVKVSSDSWIISQTSQLTIKYQTVSVNIKELFHRWEQFVLDHQMYKQKFDQCQAWLAQMKEKIASLSNASGDRITTEDRLNQVLKLLHEKEEGMHMLQIALDKLHIVLPQTSVLGRDSMRHDIQTLQQEYDALSAKLNDTKALLDCTLAEWTMFDESIHQLQRWLKDLEAQLTLDLALQNTLKEKKLQLERVKVLQLNASSQQGTVDSLHEKAHNLEPMSKGDSLDSQISNVANRFQNLVKKAKDLTEQCEKNVRDHEIYRNSYIDMSDWLASAMNKLGCCSDVSGDRITIEVQLQKLKDIAKTIEVGSKKLQELNHKGDITIQQTAATGQNLIQEELKLLNSDFDGFVSDFSDILNTFETLKEKWIEYEACYEKLSHWIKNTENNLKTDSDLKTSMDQKMVQLDCHRAIHDEIIQKKEDFDLLGEKGQVLLQHTVDGEVSIQLTQLSSRYSALITLSKDLLKRYDHTVQDHEHYSNAYSSSKAWLQEATEKLSKYADTSGDIHSIQAQLKKLQEFVVAKEEGQIYLNAAVTWGEKSMASTSVEGRELIRNELQQLQTEWDSLITQVTDNKAILESHLLQWNDYSASHEQILKWLKDMEKCLRETQPKSDLNEKKIELQHIKGMYQNIVSYEQLVESLISQAANLAKKSPASRASVDISQIQTRYNSLKEQAKDLLARNELTVAQHQDFHDSCHSFSSWLRTAVEKLAICSDTFGEKTAIFDKIERTKSLLANLNEGTQRLSSATMAGEAALTTTSASGQMKIRQELQAINKDFEEFHVQLVKTLPQLESCLSLWDDFENSYQEFSHWLRETEVVLRTELKYDATLEEKKQRWEEYQLTSEDIASYKVSLDRISEKAQALFKTNAEVKTSHAIAQLTLRYNGILSLTKNITKNLETYYDNHKVYTERHSLFTDWLRNTKKKLEIIGDGNDSKEGVLEQISEVEEIQKTLDQGYAVLHNFLESCEKTLPNTNQKGAQVIRNEADAAKAAYESILTQISEVKRSLTSALRHWEDFGQLYQQMSGWVSDAEQKLNASHELNSDLPEKRSSLERYKALQTDILEHRIQLNKLEEIADLLKDSSSKSKIEPLKARYAALVKNSKDVLANAEEQVGCHEEYHKSFIECLDWLTNSKNYLQRLADISGDKGALQGKLTHLRGFKADLGQGQEMFLHLSILAEKLCSTTSSYGQDLVHKKMDNIHEDWKFTLSAAEDIERNLEANIANWTELEKDQHEFKSWLEKMNRKLMDCQETKADLARKLVQLQNAEDLYTELLDHNAEMNKIKDKGDEITKRSKDMAVANNIMQLFTAYQSLCTSTKNTLSKLKEFVQDHKLYNDALDSAATWLKMMIKRVLACNNSSGDWHTIEKRIEDIKVIAASMDDGLQKVNYVCDLAEKVLPHTSQEGKKLIDEQVTELTNDWEKLNSDITECTTVLEDIQQKWHDYEQYHSSLVKWLVDRENSLKEVPESFVQLSECKTQLDRFKMILAEVENHERFIDELTEMVYSSEALSNTPEVADSLKDVRERYSLVISRAKKIVELLQKNYDEHHFFFEAHQGCEKWLLDMSYRLISCNKLNTRTMELTNKQIEKHRLLLQEVEDYHPKLDSVSHIGQELILSYQNQPDLATEVQAQLSNLEESYLNIQSSAYQIRDQLAEILKKWESYKEYLDSIYEYLTINFQEWLAQAEEDTPNTHKEAQKQEEVTQAELEKLYSMKKELLNAGGQCVTLISTEQADTKENLHSSVSLLAEQVNSEMTTCISQAEKHLARLREIMKKWDSVDKTRQDIRRWLHDKQEELSAIESRPSKLYSEAAEIDLERLKAFRSEVRARAPAIEELQNHYRSLTQHGSSSVDPVIASIQDDWEELLGQIDILIHEREGDKTQLQDFQAHQDTVDKYLEMYAQELERIDKADNPVRNKSFQMQRRRCRSTQTQSFGTGSDSEDNGPSPWKSPRGPKGRGGATGGNSGVKGSSQFPQSHLRGSPSAVGRSLNTSKSNVRSHRHHNDSQDSRNFKKSFGANATLESESEESGYGDTYGYTMTSLSFEAHLDEQSFLMESEQAQSLLNYIESDDESTGSFITGEFPLVDSKNLINAGTQTPNHVRTQTLELQGFHHTIGMQTSTTSLHSVGAQTKRSSGSRADLLKNILLEVKDIKKQQGLNDSRDETMSVSSDMTINRDMLEKLHRDLANLKATGTLRNSTTQTVFEQGTQTSMRLFPENNLKKQAQQERMSSMLEEIQGLKGENLNTMPSHVEHRLLDLDQNINSSSLNRTPLMRFDSSHRPIHNHLATTLPMAEPTVNHHIQTPVNINATYSSLEHPMMNEGRRRVTQDDLNSVSERLDRLNNYHIPHRQHPLISSYQPQVLIPPTQPQVVVPAAQASSRRYRIREFSRSFDDIDIDKYSRRRGRNYQGVLNRDAVMDRYHLDDALLEATITARELKRMSAKMKRNLQEELTRSRYSRH